MEKNEILSNINSTKYWHFGPDLMFKVFLLIFDYFTYFNKNIELNLPKRKKIQKDDFLKGPQIISKTKQNWILPGVL